MGTSDRHRISKAGDRDMSAEKEDALRPERVSPSRSSDFVTKATSLALELEQLFHQDGSAVGDQYRLRLARAHLLSAIDVLRELAAQQAARAPTPPTSGVYVVPDGASPARS
jgi:hypothetical protein